MVYIGGGREATGAAGAIVTRPSGAGGRVDGGGGPCAWKRGENGCDCDRGDSTCWYVGSLVGGRGASTTATPNSPPPFPVRARAVADGAGDGCARDPGVRDRGGNTYEHR